MSLLVSQNPNGKKRSRETSELFDSVFKFFMDFANKAETLVPQPKRRVGVDDDAIKEVRDDDEEPLEAGGDGDAGELFHILPVRDKEELLKEVLGEIVGNMLDNLPEEGKEAFLVRCFVGLFSKLPYDSQRVIEIKVKDASSLSQEDFATPSAPGSPSAIPKQFPSDGLQPVWYKVNRPQAIGNPPQPQPQPRPPQPRPCLTAGRG